MTHPVLLRLSPACPSTCAYIRCTRVSNVKLHPTKMNGAEEDLRGASGLKKKKKNSLPSFSAGALRKSRVNRDHEPGHSEPWGPVQPGGFCEQETTSPPALG